MATRARILSAARRLSRTGERPTLVEVAQAAGVSRATLHRVVGSRADLLTAIDADPDPGTRDRVLQAALELVGHNGLSGLSMDQLAAQAGTSRANLYRLFPGKAALFRELVAAYSPLQPILEVLEERGEDPPEVVMPELARRAARHLDGRIGLVRTLFLEITGSEPEAEGGRELALRRGFGAAAAYIVAQMQAGRLRPMDPALAIQMFVGPVMVHLMTRPVAERFLGELPPLDVAVTQLAEGWLRAMKTEA
jgi:AcrR family transcriptional regulator